MQKTRIYCVEQIDGGTSFGIREDNGDTVFIPAGVAKRIKLSIGDTGIASVIPNTQHLEKVPWYAVFVTKDVQRVSDADVEVEPEDRDLERIFDLLTAERGYFTAQEVADVCGFAVEFARSKLGELFSNNRILRAPVQRGPKGIVELELWALNPADFLSEGADG